MEDWVKGFVRAGVGLTLFCTLGPSEEGVSATSVGINGALHRIIDQFVIRWYYHHSTTPCIKQPAKKKKLLIDTALQKK